MRVRRSMGTTLLVAVTLLLAGCGGDDAEPADDDTTAADDGAADDDTDDAASVEDDDADDTAGDGEEVADDEPPPAPPSEESCDDRGAALAMDEVVTGTVPAGGEATYFCVEVPPGNTAVTFTLSGLTAEATLWVAHDTYEEVVNGGFNLKDAEGDAASDAVIVFEPSSYRGELIGFDTYADVTPGPYWIELYGDEEGPFSLVVTGSS